MKNSSLYISCLLVIITIAGCASIKKQNTIDTAFDTQAHRGGRGLMPENTIEAMKDAIDRNVRTLEMDLQISKDKQVIVSHDPYFNEKITTTPDGEFLTKKESRKALLYNLPYSEIKKYDVGMKTNPDFPHKKNTPARVPLLSELINETEAHAKAKNRLMQYNIEIKATESGDYSEHPPVEEFVNLALKVIIDGQISKRTMIQSFDTRVLQILHQKYPDMATSYLVNYKEKRSVSELVSALGFTPNVFSPDYRHVTAELVSYCHSLNMKVIPWTVNDIETMKSLKVMNVDGIITDYPDLFDQL